MNGWSIGGRSRWRSSHLLVVVPPFGHQFPGYFPRDMRRRTPHRATSGASPAPTLSLLVAAHLSRQRLPAGALLALAAEEGGGR